MEIDRPIRLQLYLARCGVGSRRGCERLIEGGLVTVDGELVTTLGTRVTANQKVALRGRPVHPETRMRYLVVNKPKGYLCSASDDRGRHLVSELFERRVSQRLFHVGRLDYESEGIIFYTNDGEFARIASHPSSRIEKEYTVESEDRIETELLDSFVRGVRYEGVRYRIVAYTRRGNHRVSIRLHEGKNREIRQLFRFAGYRVRSLRRVRIGIVGQSGIPLGGYREMKKHEVDWFLARAGKHG